MKYSWLWMLFVLVSFYSSAQSRLMIDNHVNFDNEKLVEFQPESYIVGSERWKDNQNVDAVYLVDEVDSMILLYNKIEYDKYEQSRLAIPQNVAMVINSIITSSVETAMLKSKDMLYFDSTPMYYCFCKGKETRVLMINPIKNTSCGRLEVLCEILYKAIKEKDASQLLNSMQYFLELDEEFKGRYPIDLYELTSYGVMSRMSRDFFTYTMSMGRTTISLAIEAPDELRGYQDELMDYSEKSKNKYLSLMIECCKWQLINQSKDLYVELIFTDDKVDYNLSIEASGFYGGAYSVTLPKNKLSVEGIKESLSKVCSYVDLGEYFVEF